MLTSARGQSLKAEVIQSSTAPVKKEIFGQPLGPNDLEDNLVGLQGLAVDAAGQSWVEALSEPFAYRQLFGNHLVFCIVLQNLRREEEKNEWGGLLQLKLKKNVMRSTSLSFYFQ